MHKSFCNFNCEEYCGWPPTKQIEGEKNAKYRELKITEIHYDEFLNDYDNRKNELEDRVSEASASVVRYLTLISINCGQVDKASDVTTMDISSLEQTNDENIPASELQDRKYCASLGLHKRHSKTNLPPWAKGEQWVYDSN